MSVKYSKAQPVDKYSIIKGIAILFIVSIHVLYKFHGHDKPRMLEALNYLIGFAVPLFMILGGFFITKKLENIKSAEDIKVLFLRIVNRLLIPYYIFIVILTCFLYLDGKQLSILPFLLIDANTHGLYFIIIYIYAYAVSGLSAYFFIVILKLNKNVILAITLPLLSLLFFPLSKTLINYFPNCNVAHSLSFVSYFIFGFPVAIFCRKISSSNTSRKFICLFVICIFCIFYSLCLLFARKIFGHFPIISDSPPSLLRLIFCLCAFLFLYIILDEIKIITVIGNKLLFNKLGDESLFIYFVHPYFIYFLPFIFNHFFKYFIKNNMFIVPWIISSYLIAFLSLKILYILPLKYKSIFSR